MVKRCCFVTHPEPTISGLLRRSPKPLKTSPGPIFCSDHPAEISAQKWGPSEKQILETRCIKQHAIWVDRLRDLYERGLETRKGLEIRLPRRNFEPIPTDKESPSFERRKGSKASRPPCVAGPPELFGRALVESDAFQPTTRSCKL